MDLNVNENLEILVNRELISSYRNYEQEQFRTDGLNRVIESGEILEMVFKDGTILSIRSCHNQNCANGSSLQISVS